ncbi:MAG: cytochrome c family protein [Alphaproteobacteria bacterium]|jgi:cytochrome c|nr:cytochrome c family protein [Alphaproteobacteria bacterium]
MKLLVLMTAAAALHGVTLVTPAMAAGDVAAGEKVFGKCKVCHTVDSGGKNLVGPNLHGVIGRKAATVSGFNYSSSLAALGVTWDEANLAAYLADPRKFNPGTKMVFAGLKKQQELDDVIAYLKAAQ